MRIKITERQLEAIVSEARNHVTEETLDEGKKRKLKKCQESCGNQDLGAVADSACMDRCLGSMAGPPSGGDGPIAAARPTKPSREIPKPQA